MQVFTIANHKGGVGKSTFACHLSWYLQEEKRRVLHIDLDQQANSSATLSDHYTGTLSSEFFKSATPPQIIAGESGITLAQGGAHLLGLERLETGAIQKFALNLEAQGEHFDAVVIDTPPTPGLIMSAALIAATDVISPIELDGYSIDGFTSLIKMVIGIKKKYNPSLNFIGALPNRFNATSPTQKANLADLITHHAQFVVPTKIPTRTAISDALREKVPVWKLGKTSARVAGKELKTVIETILARSSKS